MYTFICEILNRACYVQILNLGTENIKNGTIQVGKL